MRCLLLLALLTVSPLGSMRAAPPGGARSFHKKSSSALPGIDRGGKLCIRFLDARYSSRAES